MNEKKIVAELNKLKTKWRRVTDLLVEEELDRLLEVLPVESLEALKKGFSQEPEVAEDLITWAEETVQEREAAKAVQNMETWGNRCANRSNYVHMPVLTHYSYQDKETGTRRERFKSKPDVRCAGLLDQMVEYTQGRQLMPAGVYLQNEGGDIPQAVWDMLSNMRLRSSKGKLLWNENSAGWSYLTRTFPIAIDLLAYGHSLMTPLVPHGFVPQCPVTFRVLKDDQGTLLGTDGSGIYHPEAEQMKGLMAAYGPVAFQFRYQHESGIFAKGMLFPSSLALDSQGKPTVVLDWVQIKGLKKSVAKERIAEDSVKDVLTHGFLGIFRYRNRATGMASSFEILENIQKNDRTCRIIAKKVENALSRMIKRGPVDLLRRIEAKDQNIRHMVRIINVLSEAGSKISPIQVERIRKAAKEALGKELYRVAQGGGLRFRAHDARLDSTLKPGTCVVSGLPPGLNVAGIRFPTVLSQGLVVLKTVAPRTHHLWNDQMPPGVIIMHPQDLITCMQGDDDGDTIGISTDPEVVELFRNKVDDRVYRIESEAKRMEVPTLSEEGRALMQISQRGEVGMLTVLRAQLLAVGDVAGANALSISIQEAVDRAKKIVQYSDFRKASNLANWELQADGSYKFVHKFPEDVTPLGVFPLDMCKDWVSDRLIRSGCFSQREDGSVRPLDPLGWRQKTKSIDVDTWRLARQVSQYRGGNLVHHAHDTAWKYWHDNSQEFSMEAEVKDLEPMLYKALESQGETTQPLCLDEETYGGLYLRSGLKDFSDSLSATKRSKSDPDTKNYEINKAQSRMERKLGSLTLQELLTIWKYENRDGATNNALRAVCFDGSPILKALDLTEPNKCPFMNSTRLQNSILNALKSPKPNERLRDMILANTTHAEEVPNPEDPENGIPLHRCSECIDSLQDALVNHIRFSQSVDREGWMSNVVATINEFLIYSNQEPGPTLDPGTRHDRTEW